MAECRETIPTGHTSYAMTSWFPDYPWGAYLSNCDWTIPQVYLEGGDYRGTMARYHDSWASYDEVDDHPPRIPYLSSAWDKGAPSVAAAVAIALAHDTACWWAIPAGSTASLGDEGDPAGRLAIAATSILRHMGYSGTSAVRGYQRAVGLDDDGQCGPDTLRSLSLIS
jgi:hypothetical protein